MQTLIAILLSASLLLAGGAAKPSNENATATTRFMQVWNSIISQVESHEQTAVVSVSTSLRSTPSALGKVLTQLSANTSVKIVRSEQVLGTQWYFVSVNGQTGWVQASSLSLAGNVQNPQQLPTNVATVKDYANLYSLSSQYSRVLSQLEKGAELTIRRTVLYNNESWVYATANSSRISGWVLASQLNMPSRITTSDLEQTDTNQTYMPAYSQIGYVTSSQLNIRTAPGTNNDRVGSYSGGNRVGILETNSGWGRTADGWVYLGYIYTEGQIGTNCMIGNVITQQLNIRSGPSTNYPATGSYRMGDRVMVLEQVYSGGVYWGYTRRGWVCMSYVQPDYIPGTTTPIYGYGVVTVDSIDILDRADGAAKTIGQVTRGTVVAVLEVSVDGETTWAHIPSGWVNLNALNMRSIYEQTMIPAAPEMPTPEPTEPTNPSEPSTEPTEPSTEPTQPSTEPTEPSEAPIQPTEPTTPTTEPTVPPTEPATEPPATEPPATEPPATEPAATEPATEAPTAEPAE